MKNLQKLILIPFLLAPILSFAQDTTVNNPQAPANTPINYNIEIKSPLAPGVKTLPDLLNLIITKIINPIGGVLAVIMIMYAGFMYVTAQGEPAKISKAHQALLYAAIGAAILLGANLIAKAVQTTVNQITTQ